MDKKQNLGRNIILFSSLVVAIILGFYSLIICSLDIQYNNIYKYQDTRGSVTKIVFYQNNKVEIVDVGDSVKTYSYTISGDTISLSNGETYTILNSFSIIDNKYDTTYKTSNVKFVVSLVISIFCFGFFLFYLLLGNSSGRIKDNRPQQIDIDNQ